MKYKIGITFHEIFRLDFTVERKLTVIGDEMGHSALVISLPLYIGYAECVAYLRR
jgi:hypothetical protein